MIRYVYESWLADIESDVTSDWSTNLSEQLSQQASALLSAQAEAAGMTTQSVDTVGTIPSVASSEDTLE